jgi:hypothetical protein
MAVSDEAKSEVEAFTTESFVEIPNLGFETWTKVDYVYLNLGFKKYTRDLWYPNADQANSYWSTGNEGVTTLKSCNSIYVEGDDARTSKAARLTTIDITGAEYAAGNLFIGTYKTDMEQAANSVKFGREYAGARPLKLKGWYRYYAAAISNTDGQYPDDANYTQDTGDIYIKLWDAQDNVIAESHFIPEGTVDQYTQFEIPLTYTSKAKAAKITIVCTSSQYGGYFSGLECIGKVGVGSILYVDDFELEYYK